MPKFSKFFFFGLSLLLVFALAGCGQKSSTGSSGDNNGGNAINNVGGPVDSNNEAEQIFKQTVDVELPDSPARKTESEIRPLLKKIFGELKVNYYDNTAMGSGSLIVSYTLSRLPTANDLNAISRAMKDKGYTATLENNSSVQAVAMYSGNLYDVNINFDTKNPAIGVQYVPHVAGPQY